MADEANSCIIDTKLRPLCWGTHDYYGRGGQNQPATHRGIQPLQVAGDVVNIFGMLGGGGVQGNVVCVVYAFRRIGCWGHSNYGLAPYSNSFSNEWADESVVYDAPESTEAMWGAFASVYKGCAIDPSSTLRCWSSAQDMSDADAMADTVMPVPPLVLSVAGCFASSDAADVASALFCPPEGEVRITVRVFAMPPHDAITIYVGPNACGNATIEEAYDGTLYHCTLPPMPVGSGDGARFIVQAVQSHPLLPGVRLGRPAHTDPGFASVNYAPARHIVPVLRSLDVVNESIACTPDPDAEAGVGTLICVEPEVDSVEFKIGGAALFLGNGTETSASIGGTPCSQVRPVEGNGFNAILCSMVGMRSWFSTFGGGEPLDLVVTTDAGSNTLAAVVRLVPSWRSFVGPPISESAAVTEDFRYYSFSRGYKTIPLGAVAAIGCCCAINRARQLYCYTTNGADPTTPTTSPSVTRIDTDGLDVLSGAKGERHICIVLEGGRVRCVGRGDLVS